MTDIYDQATEREEQERAICIENARKSTYTLIPVQSCYFCGHVLASGRLFCDVECRDDWEIEQRAKMRNGGF